MKIGDLVMLSAAGRKGNANWKCLKGFGFIVNLDGRGDYPIRATWWREDMKGYFNMDFKRYEIKKFKK